MKRRRAYCAPGPQGCYVSRVRYQRLEQDMEESL